MSILRYLAIFVLGGLSLATVATSETLESGKRATAKTPAGLAAAETAIVP